MTSSGGFRWGDSNNGGYNSTGNNPSVPNFVPTSLDPDLTGDVGLRGFQTARVSYVVTATDISNDYLVVPILWQSPFVDENYTVVWALRDETGSPSLSFFLEDIHFQTASGFTAVVRVNRTPKLAGSVVDIEAIAVHD